MAFTKDTREISLSTVMRHLWKVHVDLTRSVIVGIAKGDNITLDESRLMQNQVDIGNMFEKKYGSHVADTVTSLLQDHIRIAGRLVVAVRDKDEQRAKQEEVRWFENADDIAKALSGINEKWEYGKIKQALDVHLKLTAQEATWEISGNRLKGLKYYKEALRQVNQIADALSLGLLQTIALHGQHFMGMLF